jgi:hypothetical protein
MEAQLMDPPRAPSSNGSISGLTEVHTEPQAQKALQRCGRMIEWYERGVTRARLYFRVFNTTMIVLSVATPVLILWGSTLTGTPPQPIIPPPLQAVPPAIAALCAALIAAYRWREDWIRYAVAAESLRSEQIKYETRTTADYALSLPATTALDNFVFRMESLAASEIAEWRNQLAQKTESVGEAQPGRTSSLRTGAAAAS